MNRIDSIQAQIARHTAALALAKVAAIELPAKQWQDLVPTLLQNMNAEPPNPGLKQSTLESLGYVCEEMGRLEEDILAQEQINSILTAVVQVITPEPGIQSRRGSYPQQALAAAHQQPCMTSYK